LGFGSLYTKKKAATFNPYFSLGLQMLLSSFILLRLQVQLEQELILCPFPQFPGGPLPTWSL
jgi:hypothetical protein